MISAIVIAIIITGLNMFTFYVVYEDGYWDGYRDGRNDEIKAAESIKEAGYDKNN